MTCLFAFATVSLFYLFFERPYGCFGRKGFNAVPKERRL